MAVSDVGVRNRFERHENKAFENSDDASDSGIDRGALSDSKHSLIQQLQKQKAQRLKAKAEELESRFVQQLTTQFRDVLHDIMTDDEQTLSLSAVGSNGNGVIAGSKRRSGEMPEKTFVPRDSMLTELLDIDHIRTVYNVFAAILILFSLQTLTYDLLEKGRVVLDFDLLFYAFGKFPLVLFIWLVMAFSAASVFPAFQFWAHNSHTNPRVYNAAAITAYAALQTMMLVLPVKHVIKNQLPPVSSMIVTVEQIRLMMKIHAFVRESAPRVLHYYRQPKQECQQGQPPCPDFSQFLYFMFAPTLVYRERYPRTARINWQFVVSNIFQVVVCIFYTYYIFERFCVPVFRNFNHEHLTPKAFLYAVFGCMMPGTLVLLIAFFAVLHSWLNAFAEMLRFADRLFYKDWWNSTSFSHYYRTWNIVVHDWLYAYVYKDFLLVLSKSNRWLAMFLTFLLSAVFHEYVLVMTLGFFYPVLFVMLGGIGCLYNFISGPMLGLRGARAYNIMIWLQLFTGTGLLMCLYSMEWYARQNCPNKFTVEYRFLDYVVPRSWFCQ